MRILVVPKDFPSPAQPGAGVFVLSQIRALQELGHDVKVLRIVPHAPPFGDKWNVYRSIPARYTYDGVEVKTIRAFFPPRMIGMEYLWLQVFNAVRNEARRFGADVIHAHCLLPEGSVAAHQSIPTVVTAHGSDAYDWPWRRPGLTAAARDTVARAGRVVAVSDFIRRQIVRLGSENASVVFNGADDGIFAPRDRETARAELGLSGERRIIAFAGRLHTAKGLFDLIDAVAALKDLAVTLVVAGEGSELERAEQAAKAQNVDVKFMGVLEPSKLTTVFAACDVMALPSYNEGLPVVVCEAMLCGRAVVTTPVGGIPEIIANGRTGMLVPPGDVAQLTSALRCLLEDAALRVRIEDSAYAFARDHLTWRLNARAYDTIYRELLANAASREALRTPGVARDTQSKRSA